MIMYITRPVNTTAGQYATVSQTSAQHIADGVQHILRQLPVYMKQLYNIPAD
jgi:hypothetical protein